MDGAAWDALRAVAPLVTADRPNVGRTARVDEGKHKGKVGRITWHGRDKFTQAYRYGDSMSHHMTDMRGRWGFRVRLVDLETAEAFFVSAEYLMVCID